MELMEKSISARYLIPRKKLFEELYERAFPAVARFISTMNGSFEDAKDIFQDALVIFYERKQSEHFHLHTSEESYILGICKHLWSKKFRKNKKLVRLDSESSQRITEEYTPSIHEHSLLQLLERSGKKCLDLLHAFYFEKLPVKKIASLFGYSNEHSASVQKYKCVEKLRDIVKQKKISYEDFTE